LTIVAAADQVVGIQKKKIDRDDQTRFKKRVKILLQNWWTDVGVPVDQ